MNRPLRCIILDDEINNVNVLKSMLQKHCPQVSIVASVNDSTIGLQLIKDLQPDLVFLDIEMPNLNGFEVLKKIEPISFEVVFVTAFADYAIEAFEYHAIGYITKPIDTDKLLSAVNNAQARIEEKKTNATIFSLLETKIHNHKESKIALGTLKGMLFVDEAEIMYCESNGSYTNFHTIDNKKIMVSKPIGEYEKSLPEGSFVRIHDKYIINLKYLNEYIKGRGGEVRINNAITLPVSVNRKDHLMLRFDRWMNR